MNPISVIMLEGVARENKQAAEQLADHLDVIATAAGITERPPFDKLAAAVVARLFAVEAENTGLRARVAEESAKADVLRDLLSSREDAYQEHTAVMDLLTADDVLCRLGFVEAFEALKARADEALSEPPAPLRLGRGPTGDEVKQHGVGVGLWLVHFAGDAPDRWHVVCFRAIDDEDARPTDFEIDEVGWTDIAVDYDDAIPLDSNRQPCPVGGGRGTL